MTHSLSHPLSLSGRQRHPIGAHSPVPRRPRPALPLMRFTGGWDPWVWWGWRRRPRGDRRRCPATYPHPGAIGGGSISELLLADPSELLPVEAVEEVLLRPRRRRPRPGATSTVPHVTTSTGLIGRRRRMKCVTSPPVKRTVSLNQDHYGVSLSN
jgi:hypothetical protein